MRTLLRQHLPLVLWLMLCMGPPAAMPQSASAQKATCKPAPSARVTSFRIDPSEHDPVSGADYSTGPLHILYSDGCEFVQRLPPKEVSEGMTISALGYRDPQIAPDGRTAGWLEEHENCCTSYALPTGLVLFRHGHVQRPILPSMMIYGWAFMKNGKRVALSGGPAHGDQPPTYQLCDASSGKLLAQFPAERMTEGDLEPKGSRSRPPRWVREFDAIGKKRAESERERPQ